MPQFFNILGFSDFGGGASFDTSVLIEQVLPNRAGTLQEGAVCASGQGMCPSHQVPLPPGEGTHGIDDIYLCC
jgi:hypothetical protein